ncbi:MAG: GreA/GreB family elongation factor [Chloroflexota bacterium]|nr:GreA/GreB family elongation factor [Chloroflexota bacterium]
MSADSPVGAALLGRRVGDAVTIRAPSGAWTATITKIE